MKPKMHPKPRNTDKTRRPPPPRLSAEYVEKEAMNDSGLVRNSILQGVLERKKVKTSDTFIPTSTSYRENKCQLPPIQSQAITPPTHVTTESEPTEKNQSSEKGTQKLGGSMEIEEVPERVKFDPIDFGTLKSLEDVKKINADHLKHELSRLGLKCGGTPDQRAERLWIIVQNPMKLHDPKLQAVPAKKA